MSTIWGLDHIKKKHTLYRGKDCIKKFCQSLKGHTKIIIGFKKEKNVTINKKELKLHEDVKVCSICGKYFTKKLFRDINHWKVRDPCPYTGKYRGAAHSICN